MRRSVTGELRHAFVSLTAFLVMCTVLISLAGAQTSKGTLVGTVRDPDGAVIPGASLTVISQETGETRHVISDAQGDFRIEAISPGDYSIRVEATGFEVVDVKHLAIVPSAVTSYQPVLHPGRASSTIEVDATAGNQINTENAQISETLGSTELANLPIFSLNPIELAATLPGVQFINDTSLAIQGAGGNFVHIEVNGARPRANNFMLDGQDINDVGLGGQAFGIVIPDMFQSETVITNNPPAEFGRAGGAVVNLITKAGTNNFHGSLFELYSGSGLNAVDGQTREATPKDRANKARFDEHQYGFTLGGPVVKNKLFAFGAAQWSRFYGKSSSTQIQLPDAAGYATLTSIGGPQVALLQELLGGGSYLTQFIPHPEQGVVGINVGQQNGCPAGGCNITTGFFQRPPVDQQEPDTQWIVRADYLPSEKDTFTVRYLHDLQSFTPDLGLNTSGLPGFDGEVGGPAEFGGVSWTHVFSPRLVNELRGSITRVNFVFQATPDALANPASKLPTLVFSDSGLPALGLSQNIPQGTKENYYQYQDTVSLTLGRQSLRVGADVGRVLESDGVAQLYIGQITYAKGAAGITGLGNFLSNQTGPSGSVTKSFGPTRIDPHTWRTAFFAQDDIKVRPSLTVNLGLRYDYLTDPGNSVRYPAVDPNNLSAPIDSVFKIKTDKSNWGPRFGFAYTPGGPRWLGNGNTVIHGGAGIYYDTSFSNIVTNTAQASPNAPTGLLETTSGGGIQDPLAALATISPDLSPSDAVFSVSKNIVNPSTYEWNFGFERSLPADLSRGRQAPSTSRVSIPMETEA